MRAEYAFDETAGLEQDESQQHAKVHAHPNGFGDIGVPGDVLRQHGIDCDTYYDEQILTNTSCRFV